MSITTYAQALESFLEIARIQATSKGEPLTQVQVSALTQGFESGWLMMMDQVQTTTEQAIALPREMDEDLYYIVGGAMGAQSPEQCERATVLWDKLVARADRDAQRRRAT